MGAGRRLAAMYTTPSRHRHLLPNNTRKLNLYRSSNRVKVLLRLRMPKMVIPLTITLPHLLQIFSRAPLLVGRINPNRLLINRLLYTNQFRRRHRRHILRST